MVTIVAAALLAGCDGDEKGSAGSSNSELPQGADPVKLDPATFSAEVDNRYWPMKPGTRWTYREVDEEGKRLKVVVTATSETKRIANGVTARVVRDTVTEDGELIEDTFDWYAQDDEGNVWYLGEDTAEFENGQLTTPRRVVRGRRRRRAARHHHARRTRGRACATGRSTTRARPRTTARC